MLAIVAAALGLSAAVAAAQGAFSDNFEAYTNGTPLIDGTNNGTGSYGWYGSSAEIVVQTNLHYPEDGSSTNAAMIPDDCTLSNRVANITSTNVWVLMDVLPVMYEGTMDPVYEGATNPVIDTNAVWMFYVNTNGNFVVHDGAPSPDPTNSDNWVTTVNGGIGTNGTNWVSLQIRMNFANQTWALYNVTTNNKILVARELGFINPGRTNFDGFSVYNGLSTSYMDNVSVTNPPGTNLYLIVAPTGQTHSVMMDYTTNAALTISNPSLSTMFWMAGTTDAWLQIVGATNGSVAAGESTNLVVMNSGVALTGGTYTGSVMVAATNVDGYYSPEEATATFVLQVMELQRAPAQLTDAVMQGEVTNNSFMVWNAGPGTFDYTVSANQPWLLLSQAGGSLTGQTAGATNTIGVTYTNTAALSIGDHHGVITISVPQGGSLNLGVTLSVRAVPMLSVNPTLLTNSVMAGQSLASQTLRAWNGSPYYGIGYQVTTNGGAGWLTVQVPSTYLAPLATNTFTVNTAVSALTPAGDMPSNYTASITITATNRAEGSPVTIPVTVQVNPKPRLAISLTNLSQAVLQGRDAVSQSFDVWNANGFYTLNYTVTKTAPWLVLTPVSGSSTGQHMRIDVQYSTANLPAGTTNALITVVGQAWDGAHADSAVNATQQIAVALSITPFATLATDAQPAYAYTVRKGLTPPDTVLNIWNAGNLSGDMYFTVTPSAGGLSATPQSGTSAGDMDMVVCRVQADAAAMLPGVVYRGTVRIDATDSGSGTPAYGSPRLFTISVVLREFKGFDFQGGLSGASDLVLYREASGAWEIKNLLSNYATTQFLGGVGYQAVPGDYFGDGITDMGVYRPESGGWYAQQVGAGSAEIVGVEMQAWAGMEYVGVQGDYDGDGKTDPGVYLETSGLWMVLMSAYGYQQVSATFGGPEFSALQAGDYDGDGKVDPGVYHRISGLWRVLLSSSGYAEVWGTFGGTGFTAVPTDYDGDDITDPAIYETETGRWNILPSTMLTSQGYILATYQFGGTALSPTLVPAPGNYDGVGGADLALYDTGTWSWYIMTLDGVPLAWGYPMGRLGSWPVRP